MLAFTGQLSFHNRIIGPDAAVLIIIYVYGAFMCMARAKA